MYFSVIVFADICRYMKICADICIYMIICICIFNFELAVARCVFH